MTDYLKGNLNNLIIQYSDRPKAVATIEAITSECENLFDVINLFNTAFDLDFAVGKQLDILGKIVGISRNVPFSVPKKYFGFDLDANSYPMADLFLTNESYPFKDVFEIPYTSGQLNDYDYRFFIKAKIIKNYSTSKAIDENKLSIADAVDYLFKSKAFIVDNLDMTLTIYIDAEFNLDRLIYLKQLDLLPRPQGVRYNYIMQFSNDNTFGFGDNSNGFADLFNPLAIGGRFANIIQF